MKKPTVTWHAGALNTKPNTIESIKTAIKNNAEIIEVDVSFRPDGTPVIIHSNSPAENEGVLFEEAINALSKGNSKINLDIKSTANLSAIDEIIIKNQMLERVFYTGVFADWVETVRNNSQISYYLNHTVSKSESTDKYAAQTVADKALLLGAIGINSDFKTASKLFCDIIHQNKLKVSLWTANTKEEMLKVIEMIPDNITTENPDIMNEILIQK